MPSRFERVKPQDPLSIPADAYNAMLDAAEGFIDEGASQGAESMEWLTSRVNNSILIKNDSSYDIPRFGVLAVREPVITPAANPAEFANRVALTARVPLQGDEGKFIVSVEPIPAGAFGNAWVSGVCIAKLNVTAEGDKNADIEVGVYHRLKTGSSGAASILWKETGTGEKWGVIRFGQSSGGSGGMKFATIVTGEAGQAIITVQPKKADAQGVLQNDGGTIQVFTWPGLVAGDYEELVAVAAIILLVFIDGAWFAMQTIPFYMSNEGASLPIGSC